MELFKVLIFCLYTGLVNCMVEKCCQLGMNKGVQVIIQEHISCEVDNKIFETLKQKLNFKDNSQSLMCKGFYKQCCKVAAKSQYCTIGMVFGNTNQVCMKGSNELAGDAQRSCCDCCKSGRKAGAERGNCDDKNYTDELCTHAYRECCNSIKKDLPVEPTKEPGTKTCKDIKCDHQSTVSCTETSKGPQCICKKGYIAKNDHINCIDIDECERDKNICGGDKKCTNTPGGYMCSCEKGLKFVNKQCIKTEEKCKQGFESVNGSCVDIDECVTKQNECPLNMFCLNVEGSYRCKRTCNYPRYEQQYNGNSICKDVNECLNPNACQKDTHECINQIGGHICKLVRCHNGYNLNDGYCIDINECESQKGICGEKGYCRNAPGTYYCDCQKGYQVDSTTRKCNDVDECKLNRASCSYKCKNTPGSYHCTCPSGYESRGQHGAYCYDIDECKTQQPCSAAGEFCFNTFGSYRCINETCPSPYYVRAAQNSKSCQKKACQGKDRTCRALKTTSIKWQYYNMRRNFPRNNFRWTYSISGFPINYRYNYAIVEGDEEQNFSIRRIGSSRIVIVNSKDIKGPKDITLVLHADVMLYSQLKQRFVYKLHLFVSPYDL